MQAYDIVQNASLEAYKGNAEFKDLLLKDEQIKKYMSAGEIENCFSLDYHLRHVDRIFKNIGL